MTRVRKQRDRPHWARRLVQFRLRTFLLVVLVLCLFLGWVGRHLVRVAMERGAVAHIQAVGGDVYYESDFPADDKSSSDEDDISLHTIHFNYSEPMRLPEGDAFTRSIFGDDVYATVVSVQMCLSGATDADVAYFPRLKQLKHVGLASAEVTDACLDDLLKVKRLQSLTLHDTEITPAGLARLAEIASLRFIGLAGPVTDDHMKALQSVKQLESVQVVMSDLYRRPQVNDGVKYLNQLPNLRELRLNFCGLLSEASFAKLEGLTKLEGLDLQEVLLHDEAMATVAKLTSLKALQLRYVPVGNEGFFQLATLKKLQTLSLERTWVDDSAAMKMKQFPQLERLSMRETKLTDTGLGYLKELDQLKELDVQETKVTPAGVLSLASCQSLRRLDVTLDSPEMKKALKSLKAEIPQCEIHAHNAHDSDFDELIE